MREATLRSMRREELVETCSRLQRSCQDLQSSLEELREDGARLQSEKSELECQVHSADTHLTRLQRDDGFVGNFFKDIGIHQFSDFIQQVRTQTPEAAAAVAAAFGSSAQALVKDTQRHSFALPLISPPHEPALRTSLLGCQKVDADPAGLTTTELQEESAEATVHGTSAVHGPPRHARKTPGETARQFARSVTEAAAWHRTSTHSSAVLAPEGGKGGETAENGGESKWSARREAEAEIHVTPGEPTWQDPFADELVMKAVGQQGGNSVRALMHRKCTEERLQKEVAQWLKDADSMSVEEVPRGPLCRTVLRMGSSSLAPESPTGSLFPACSAVHPSLLGSPDQERLPGAPSAAPDSPEEPEMSANASERQRARLVCDARLLALQVERALGIDSVQHPRTSDVPFHSPGHSSDYTAHGVQETRAGLATDSEGTSKRFCGREVSEGDTAGDAGGRDYKAKAGQWVSGFLGDSGDLDDLCARVLGAKRSSWSTEEAAQKSSSDLRKQGQEGAEDRKPPSLGHVPDVLKRPISPDRMLRDAPGGTPPSEEVPLSREKSESGAHTEESRTQESIDGKNSCQSHPPFPAGGSCAASGEFVDDSAVESGSREGKEATTRCLAPRSGGQLDYQHDLTSCTVRQKALRDREIGESRSSRFSECSPSCVASSKSSPSPSVPAAPADFVVSPRPTTGPCPTASPMSRRPSGVGAAQEAIFSSSSEVASQPAQSTAGSTREGGAVISSCSELQVDSGHSEGACTRANVEPLQQPEYRRASGIAALRPSGATQCSRDPEKSGEQALSTGHADQGSLSSVAGGVVTQGVAAEARHSDVSALGKDPVVSASSSSKARLSPGPSSRLKSPGSSPSALDEYRRYPGVCSSSSSQISPPAPAPAGGSLPFAEVTVAEAPGLAREEAVVPSNSLSSQSRPASAENPDRTGGALQPSPQSAGTLSSSSVSPASSPTVIADCKMLPDQRVLLSWRLGPGPRALVAAAPAGIHRQVEVQLSILDLTAEFEGHDRSQPSSQSQATSSSVPQSTPPIRTARASTMLLDDLEMGREYHLTLIGRCVDLDLFSGVEELHAEPICGVTIHFHLQPDGLKSLRCRPVSLGALGLAPLTLFGRQTGCDGEPGPAEASGLSGAGEAPSKNSEGTEGRPSSPSTPDRNALYPPGSGGKELETFREQQGCREVSSVASFTSVSESLKEATACLNRSTARPPLPLPHHAATASCTGNCSGNSVSSDLSSASAVGRNSVSVPSLINVREPLRNASFLKPCPGTWRPQATAVSHAGGWTPASCYLRSRPEPHCTVRRSETGQQESGGAQSAAGGVRGSMSPGTRPGAAALAAARTIPVPAVSKEASATDSLSISQQTTAPVRVGHSGNCPSPSAASGGATVLRDAQASSSERRGDSRVQLPALPPPRSVCVSGRPNTKVVTASGTPLFGRNSSEDFLVSSSGFTSRAPSVLQLSILSSAWRAVKETAIAGQAVLESVASSSILTGPGACGRQQRGREDQRSSRRRQRSLGCVDIERRNWGIGDAYYTAEECTTSNVRSSSFTPGPGVLSGQTAVVAHPGLTSDPATTPVTPAGEFRSRSPGTRTERSPTSSQDPQLGAGSLRKAPDMFATETSQLWMPPQRVRALAAARASRHECNDAANFRSGGSASPGHRTVMGAALCANPGDCSDTVKGHKIAPVSPALSPGHYPSSSGSHSGPADGGTGGLQTRAKEGATRLVEEKGTCILNEESKEGNGKRELGLVRRRLPAEMAMGNKGWMLNVPPVASQDVGQQGCSVPPKSLRGRAPVEGAAALPQPPLLPKSCIPEEREESCGNVPPRASCGHRCVSSTPAVVKQPVHERQDRTPGPTGELKIPGVSSSTGTRSRTAAKLSDASPMAPPVSVQGTRLDTVGRLHPEKKGLKSNSSAATGAAGVQSQATEALEKLKCLQSQERELGRIIETHRRSHEERRKQADLLQCVLRGARQVCSGESAIAEKRVPSATESTPPCKEHHQQVRLSLARHPSADSGASLVSSHHCISPPVLCSGGSTRSSSHSAFDPTRVHPGANVHTPTTTRAEIKSGLSPHVARTETTFPVAAPPLARLPSRFAQAEAQEMRVRAERTANLLPQKGGQETPGQRALLLGHPRGVTHSGSPFTSSDLYSRQLWTPQQAGRAPEFLQRHSLYSSTARAPACTTGTSVSDRVSASPSRTTLCKGSGGSLESKAEVFRESGPVDSVCNSASVDSSTVTRRSHKRHTSETATASASLVPPSAYSSSARVPAGSDAPTSPPFRSAAAEFPLCVGGVGGGSPDSTWTTERRAHPPRDSPPPHAAAPPSGSASFLPKNRLQAPLPTTSSDRRYVDGSCGLSVSRGTAPVAWVSAVGQLSPIFHGYSSRNPVGPLGVRGSHPCVSALSGSFLSQPFYSPVTVPLADPTASERKNGRTPSQCGTSGPGPATLVAATALVNKGDVASSADTQMSKAQGASPQATVLVTSEGSATGALGTRQVTFY